LLKQLNLTLDLQGLDRCISTPSVPVQKVIWTCRNRRCVGNFIPKLKASSILELTESPTFGQDRLSQQQLPLVVRLREEKFWPPADLRQLGLSVGCSGTAHKPSSAAGAVELERKHLSLL